MNKQRLEQVLNDDQLMVAFYDCVNDSTARRLERLPPGAELGDVVAFARAYINVGLGEKTLLADFVTGETLAVFDLAPEGGAQQVYPTATPLPCNSQAPCASGVD